MCSAHTLVSARSEHSSYYSFEYAHAWSLHRLNCQSDDELNWRSYLLNRPSLANWDPHSWRIKRFSLTVNTVVQSAKEETIVYLSRLEGGFSTQTGLRWMLEIRRRQPYINCCCTHECVGATHICGWSPPPYVNLTSFSRPPWWTRTSLT